MIKLLFFIPGLSEGGAEKVLCSLLNSMDFTKYDITVHTIESYDSEKFLKPEIHYKSMNRCKTKTGKKIFSLFMRLMAELGLLYTFFIKDDYDLEIAYLETAATKFIAQSTNRKAKKIAWVHCDLSQKEGMQKSLHKVRKQYEKYDKIICVSEDVKRGFEWLFGTDFDVEVLYNIIDEDEILKKSRDMEFSGFDDSRKHFVAVGRLAKQKNFVYLIESLKKLLDDGYDVQLDILGEGEERGNLEKLIKLYGLEKRVFLRGFCSNPYPWMKKADYIVCSSKYEGISTVIQEALILEKPVVTTSCTGMKELLGESEYGLIAEDCENGLYCAMKQLLDDDSLELKYAQRARERSVKFSKVRILRDTEKLFEKMVSENQGEMSAEK